MAESSAATLTEVVRLRLSPALRSALERNAQSNERSLSAEIRYVLVDYLRHQPQEQDA